MDIGDAELLARIDEFDADRDGMINETEFLVREGMGRTIERIVGDGAIPDRSRA